MYFSSDLAVHCLRVVYLTRAFILNVIDVKQVYCQNMEHLYTISDSGNYPISMLTCTRSSVRTILVEKNVNEFGTDEIITDIAARNHKKKFIEQIY
jgi:hypothetical protein